MKFKNDQKRVVLRAAFGGVLMTLFIQGIFQDFIGKEKFIALCQDHWISGGWAILSNSILLIFSIVMFWVALINLDKPGGSLVDDVWASDPDYPVEDWRAEVTQDDTRLGYWDWVAHQKESG